MEKRFKIMDNEMYDFQELNKCTLVQLDEFIPNNNKFDLPEVLHEIRCICCNQKLGEIIIIFNAN
jgi:hypothetical protein